MPRIKEPSDHLGLTIKTERRKLAMTQEQLAKYCETSKSTVGGWEMGTQQPNAKELVRMSLLFKMPISILIGEDAEFDSKWVKWEETQAAGLLNQKAIMQAIVFMSSAERQQLFQRLALIIDDEQRADILSALHAQKSSESDEALDISAAAGQNKEELIVS